MQRTMIAVLTLLAGPAQAALVACPPGAALFGLGLIGMGIVTRQRPAS